MSQLLINAITIDAYGPPEVLKLEAWAVPTPGASELLVEVRATSVTTADMRFRAADFPPGMQLVGRLMAGLFKPRNRLTGFEFSGRVVAVGAGTTRHQVGDEVFGVHTSGVNAELIVVPEGAAIALKPEGITHAEAAALPFGANTAIHFLEDQIQIQPGERVLITGASGGVGVYLVQVAKAAGAEVTAVCSSPNRAFVKALGADHVIDYTVADPRDADQMWDVIVDTVHQTRFNTYRHKLSSGGRHAFIEGGVREVFQFLGNGLRRGPKVVWSVATDSHASVQRLADRVENGRLRPVIGHRFPMTEVVAAHHVVDRRHRRGAVILEWPAGEGYGS
ncbi:MAG: NAD(P)-dependent alcohol dehydrogenase [Myxococcota bacterium]